MTAESPIAALPAVAPKPPAPVEHELGSLKPRPGRVDYRRALRNPAVAHCQKVWERVYRSVLAEKGSKALARLEAGEAYRAAMPLLVGAKNIRDFIACATFGMTSAVLMEDTALNLINAAQVASRVAAANSARKTTKPSAAKNTKKSTKNGKKEPKNAPQSTPKSNHSNHLDKKLLIFEKSVAPDSQVVENE